MWLFLPMDLESAISWYGGGQFNAADMERATGLSERSQRELLKLGILQAIPQSRTATRLFDSRMLKRAALIYPLHEHGSLSLKVSGKLVYADIILESILFDSIDPWQARDRIMAKAPGAEKQWRWFAPSEDPVTEPNDYYIALINRHYVASGSAETLRVYGHLLDDRTDIVVYRGAVWDELVQPSGKVPDWLPSEFHPRSALTGNSRKFKSKSASKAERDAVKRALENPISKFVVNASLTLRLAMRRLLKIGEEESNIEAFKRKKRGE
jgi:hypothetical protein